MIEIQKGLLKEDRVFYVNGIAHYNSRLYAKDGYHFYSISEYEANKQFYEEEKARRLANNENVDNLILEKNYTTMAITPLTDNDEINAEFKSEVIENAVEER